MFYNGQMILADCDIRKAYEENRLIVKPAPDWTIQLGSCSLDLKLSKVYRVFNHSITPFIDPYDHKTFEGLTKEIKVQLGKAFTLHPGEFILAQTEEYLELPDNLAGSLEGRSSIGRLGIMVHSTAATVDPGFRGNITLELSNMGRIPVLLYPGMRICSISFIMLTRSAEVPYYLKKSAKYVGQRSPLGSKIGEDRNEKS
jgi:dCTP deaminase